MSTSTYNYCCQQSDNPNHRWRDCRPCEQASANCNLIKNPIDCNSTTLGKYCQWTANQCVAKPGAPPYATSIYPCSPTYSPNVICVGSGANTTATGTTTGIPNVTSSTIDASTGTVPGALPGAMTGASTGAVTGAAFAQGGTLGGSLTGTPSGQNSMWSNDYLAPGYEGPKYSNIINKRRSNTYWNIWSVIVIIILLIILYYLVIRPARSGTL